MIGGDGVEADVRDVSMRGVGLAVTDQTSAHLIVDEAVPIDLFVPGTEFVVRVEAVVRHLTSTEDGVRAVGVPEARGEEGVGAWETEGEGGGWGRALADCTHAVSVASFARNGCTLRTPQHSLCPSS